MAAEIVDTEQNLARSLDREEDRSVTAEQSVDRMSTEVLVVGGSRGSLNREDLRHTAKGKLSKGTAKRVTLVLLFIAVIGGGCILFRGQWRRMLGGPQETLASMGDAHQIPASFSLAQTAQGGRVPRPRLKENGPPSQREAGSGEAGSDSAEQLTLQLLQQQAKILQLLDNKLKNKEQRGNDEGTGPSEQQHKQEGPHPQQPQLGDGLKDWQHHQLAGQRPQAPALPQAPAAPRTFPGPQRTLSKSAYEREPIPRSVSSREGTQGTDNRLPRRQLSDSAGSHRQGYMAPSARNTGQTASRISARYSYAFPDSQSRPQESKAIAAQPPSKSLDAASLFKKSQEDIKNRRFGLMKKITVHQEEPKAPRPAPRQDNGLSNAARMFEKSELQKMADKAARMLEESEKRTSGKGASRSSQQSQKPEEVKDAAKMFQESHQRTQFQNRQAFGRNGWRR